MGISTLLHTMVSFVLLFEYMLRYRARVGKNWPVMEAVTQEVLLNHGFDLHPVSSSYTASCSILLHFTSISQFATDLNYAF